MVRPATDLKAGWHYRYADEGFEDNAYTLPTDLVLVQRRGQRESDQLGFGWANWLTHAPEHLPSAGPSLLPVVSLTTQVFHPLQ